MMAVMSPDCVTHYCQRVGQFCLGILTGTLGCWFLFSLVYAWPCQELLIGICWNPRHPNPSPLKKKKKNAKRNCKSTKSLT